MLVDLFLDQRKFEVFRVSDKVFGKSGNKYEIGERVACGGNAVVHKCVNTRSGDEFAIKFQLSLNRKRVRRFLREIKLLKEIQHEQLIQYIDHGHTSSYKTYRGGREQFTDDKSLPFLVMPLAVSNLAEFLTKANQGLLYDDYIGQFKGLARALSALHEKAIHRDIKPENILVIGDAWVLSDFGLCKFNNCAQELTESDEPVGPRYWMSPEAINRAIGNDDEISKGSDVFQLCSVFWRIVTGRHPSGCVCREDWTGPLNIFNLLLEALSHDQRKRPADGARLVQLLDSVTLPSRV